MALRTTAQDGNWSNPSTWTGGNIPGSGDTWEIYHDVVLDTEPASGISTGTVKGGGRLTIAYQISASSFPNITVQSGGVLRASRSQSNLLRVAGMLTVQTGGLLDYGTTSDPIPKAVGAVVELVCTSDQQSGRSFSFADPTCAAFCGEERVTYAELAQAASVGQTTIVLDRDVDWRPGTLDQVYKGEADLIVVGHTVTRATGDGGKNHQIDIYRVVAYDPVTRTVTLGDAGAGDADWPRGGTSPNWNDIDTAREAGTPVWLVTTNVMVRGSAYNLRPDYTGTSGSVYYVDRCCHLWVYRGIYNYPIPRGWLSVLSSTRGAENIYGYWPGDVVFVGCNQPLYGGTGVLGGNVVVLGGGSNYYGVITVTGRLEMYSLSGAITNRALYSVKRPGSVVIKDCDTAVALLSLVGCNVELDGNKYHLSQVADMFLHNVKVGSGTEHRYRTDPDYLPPHRYIEFTDYQQVPGAYRALTLGATVVSDTETVPPGYEKSFRLLLISASYPGHYRAQFIVPPRATLTVSGYLRKDASMSPLPKATLANALEDPFVVEVWGYEPRSDYLDSFTMTNSVDRWEPFALSWENTGDDLVEVVFRVVAKAASGNVWVAYEAEIAKPSEPLPPSAIPVGQLEVEVEAEGELEVELD